MPFYELVLILRTMPKKETTDCLKRVADLIWKENGVLKKIEFLGHNQLPYAIPSPEEATRHHEGSYFLYHVSINGSKWPVLRPEFKLDLDIIKVSYNVKNESRVPVGYQCTLSEELLPPIERKSVKPLLDDKNVLADIRR